MVYDNLGNLVLKEKGNNNELNIDHLGSGVYLIGLWMGDGVVYERVVKL